MEGKEKYLFDWKREGVGLVDWVVVGEMGGGMGEDRVWKELDRLGYDRI